MLKEADEANGWRLKKKQEEVSRVKNHSQARAARLQQDKRNLMSEVQGIKKTSQEAVRKVKDKHKDNLAQMALKVKCVKKLSQAEARTTTKKHNDEVTKLERQKVALRKHAAQQRTQLKDRMREVQAKHVALQLQCSASQVATNKLTRELSAARASTCDIQERTMLLEEQLEMQGIENDGLCTDLVAKDDALVVAMDAVDVAKKHQSRLEAEGKAAQRKAEGRFNAFQKKLEAHRTKDKVHQRRIRRLKEKLATTMKVIY